VEDEMLMLQAHVTQRKWHLISVLTQTSKEHKSYLTDLKRPCRPWPRPLFSRYLRRCGCIRSCSMSLFSVNSCCFTHGLFLYFIYFCFYPVMIMHY